MLVIYNKDATTYNNLGLGILKDFYSNPLITEVLNGEYNLEFEYISEGWLADKLEIGNIIKARGQLFRIWNIQPDLKKIKVLAKHIFFDLSKNFLEDVSPTNLTSQNALTWILARTSTENDYTVTGDCTATASVRYVRKNVIDAIYNEDNALLKKFGGELELNNFNIYVHQKRGSDSGISVMYGKNLSGVQMDVDLSTVVTKIMPQGKDGLLLDKLYVESPLLENYFSPFYQKIEFSDIGVDEDNNISESDAKNQLRLAAQKLFNEGIDKPTISIKFDFIELSKATEYKQYENLETVSLGDTVKAIIPKLNVSLETRVVKTVYDCLLERTTKIECGTVTPNIVTKQSENTREITNKLQEIDVSSILSEAQANATDLINHPFGGHIFISESTGELYIMNTNDPTTATQVWKWGLGGLGFSSNGISGPYGVAMTQDGKINADYITTGTLSASVIEGYSNLLIQVNKLVNLVKSTTGENYIHIEDAAEGQLQELIIEGNISLIYPATDLYPASDLYPIDTYLIISPTRTISQVSKRYHLPISSLTTNEKFKYIKGECYFIHSDETIEKLTDLDIQLLDGDNFIFLESFQNNINLSAKYVVKSEYTDVFSTKAEMHSAINQTSQTIDLKLEKKTDKDNIIAQINMSTEKDNHGSYIGIEADKLNFKGKKFNLTADDIEITSDLLNLTKEGKLTIIDDASGNISNLEIIKNTGEKCDIWGRSIDFTESSTIHSRFGLNSLDIYNGIKYLTYDQGNLYISGQIYPSSIKKMKKNIEKLENGLSIVNSVEIYKYNMKYEQDNVKKHIGFIIDDEYNYSKEITSMENNSVDLYSMIAVAYKAIQELYKEINELKEMINNGIQ